MSAVANSSTAGSQRLGLEGDPVKERQRRLLRSILIGALVLLGINLAIALLILGPAFFDLRLLGPSLIAAAGGVASLQVLNRGPLLPAGLLATASFLVGDTWEFLRAGLYGSEIGLLMFLVPALIAGLLLRRLVIYLTGGTILSIVVGVHILELFVIGGQTVSSTGSVLLLSLILVLLTLFFDRFGIALRDALTEEAESRSQLARLYEQTRALNESLEQRVAERTAELENANKELESFSYSVSHDLRAPLRSIDGFSRALVEDCGDELSEMGRNYLDRISGGARRMGEIIDDLLEFSHLGREPVEDKTFDLSSAAREVYELLREQEGPRQIEFSVEEGLVGRGNPRLIRTVLENLIGNSIKFTRERETAVIEVGWSDEKSAYFVCDNGIGFDMAHEDKLFKPFQRLHADIQAEGTGIGLANVKRVIDRHGGRVWARSKPGAGATFFFTLPDASEAPASEVAAASVR